MKIWVNTIVHNEENFIWFAIMSVVDFVDKVLIYDTGSNDKTIKIIKEIQKIKGKKIEFKEIGVVDRNQFTKVRQEMLDCSDCDWILIVDGDEIWWQNSIKKVIEKINKKGKKLDGIVVPTILPVGDIYHIQEDIAGKYEILGRRGHFNLRAINKKISGLHVSGAYPLEGYRDSDERLIQESNRTTFVNTPYLHVTHLTRSSVKRSFDKYKYELGDSVSKNFKYPEVLYKNYPPFIKSPWTRISGMSLVKSKLLTPLRKIKRRLR